MLHLTTRPALPFRYRKHFKLPAEWEGSSVWLYCEGAFHETTAWLNGAKVGYHKQGYTAFSLRLDNIPGVKFGGEENVLAVYMDASSGTGWWYEGGGLSRHNWLVRAAPAHIQQDGAWVHTSPAASPSSGAAGASDGANFHASVQVVNDGPAAVVVTVRTTVRDTAGSIVATGSSGAPASVPPSGAPLGAPIVATATATAVKHWTVQAPHLYTVTIEVVAGDTNTVLDTTNITSGVRTVRFDANKGLFVNDVAIKMRGFCDHSSFAGLGAAVPDRVELFRAQALRSVGGNAWRMVRSWRGQGEAIG